MTAADIETALANITAAAGDRAASDDNPCGLVASYEGGSSRPWLLADDWVYDRYATAEEAKAAAATWGAD